MQFTIRTTLALTITAAAILSNSSCYAARDSTSNLQIVPYKDPHSTSNLQIVPYKDPHSPSNLQIVPYKDPHSPSNLQIVPHSQKSSKNGPKGSSNRQPVGKLRIEVLGNKKTSDRDEPHVELLEDEEAPSGQRPLSEQRTSSNRQNRYDPSSYVSKDRKALDPHSSFGAHVEAYSKYEDRQLSEDFYKHFPNNFLELDRKYREKNKLNLRNYLGGVMQVVMLKAYLAVSSNTYIKALAYSAAGPNHVVDEYPMLIATCSQYLAVLAERLRIPGSSKPEYKDFLNDVSANVALTQSRTMQKAKNITYLLEKKLNSAKRTFRAWLRNLRWWRKKKSTHRH